MSATLLQAALWVGTLVAQGEFPMACPSGTDMQLLTALHQRRLQLDTREAALGEREKTLQALRDALDQRMQSMSGALEKFEERYLLGEPARRARDKRIAALVEAMTGLSAKKAAPMLAAADPDLTGDLLMRMGPARTAALLAIMPVARAARLMEQMSGSQKAATQALAASPAAAAPAPAATAESGPPPEKAP